MQRLINSLLILLLLTIAGFSKAAQTTYTQKIYTALMEQKQELHQDQVSVALIDKQQIHTLHIGTANNQTLYEIGSLTKLFTGLLLARLHNEGLVSLNDPISKYWPELMSYPAGLITLVELSTHTSGLPRLPANLSGRDPQNPYADYTETMAIEYLRSLTALQRPTPFNIGNYSNLGVGLLALTLSRAVQTEYETLLKQKVLQPLGMNDTSIRLARDQQKRLAKAYNSALEPVKNWTMPGLPGMGDLRSSLSDLVKFAQAQINPEESALKDDILLSRQIHAGNVDMQIGLGWLIAKINDQTVFDHSGGTGGYRSYILIYPENKKAFIQLNNSQNEAQCALAIFLLNTDCKNEFGYRVPPTLLREYAGVYKTKNNDLTFIIRENSRYLIYEIPGQESGRLTATTDTNFKIQDIAELQFKRDSSGQASQLFFKQGPTELTLDKQETN